MQLGITGPPLRSAGVALDLRKDEPYCGYETYDFDVITRTEGDAYARYRVRIDEMRESLKIVEQAFSRLAEVVGDTSVATPCSSFHTVSGLMEAAPRSARSPMPNRSPSPR